MADEQPGFERETRYAKVDPRLEQVPGVGLTLQTFKSWPVERRALAYGQYISAAYADPTTLADEELRFVGYGFLQDHEAIDWLRSNSTLSDEERYFYDVNTLLTAVNSQDPDATGLIQEGDRVQDERLFVPVLAAGLLVAGRSAAGFAAQYGLVSSVTGEAIGTGAGSATAMAIKSALLSGAARITGNTVAMTAAKLGFKVAGVSLALGTLSVGASMASNYFFPEANTEAANEQTVVSAERMEDAAGTEAFRPPWTGEQTSRAATQPNQATGFLTQGQGSEIPWDTELADLPPQWGQALNEDDPLIGVPFGWPQRFDLETGQLTGRPSPLGEGMLTYRESDVKETLANMSPGDLAWFQAQAVRAGLINPDSSAFPSYLPGMRDQRSEQALWAVMYQSNIDIRQDWTANWRRTLDRMAESGDAARAAAEAEAARSRPRYARRPYKAIDQATVRGWVNQEAERQLGRKINDWEWRTLLADVMRDDKAKYQQDEAYNQSLFEAQYRGSQGETGVAAAGSFVDVDPFARFQERFGEMFATEEERVDRLGQVSAMTGNLLNGLSNAEAAVQR